MDFETRPVDELPAARRGSGTAGFTAAFAELPIGLAIFRESPVEKGAAYATFRGAQLKARFPDRRVQSRTDKAKHGVWFWWEPKEQS